MWSVFQKKKKTQPVVVNIIDEDYVVEFCYQWNLLYPIDRWWREKHKVAFNSETHRSVSFIDMRIEWEEDQIFRRRDNSKYYNPNEGSWIKEEVFIDTDEYLTKEEKLVKYKKEFEDIDLSQYND